MKGYIYLIAPIVGWFLAQSLKFAFTLRKDGINWGDAIQSGGLPSSHAAFMVSITTVIGINYSIKSAIFGISAAITAIILYDAIGVRRATGEQTQAINELAKHDKKRLQTNIHNAKGHSFIEVMLGSLIGVLVGFGLNYLAK